MNNLTQEFSTLVGQENVKENEMLSPHTSIKIGGQVPLIVNVNTIDALTTCLEISHRYNLLVIMLGSGTSFVGPTQGMNAVVVKNNCRAFQILSETNEYTDIIVESGALTNQVVKFSIDHSLSGLEYSFELPGTIGGALCMNAMLPKYDHKTSDALYKATILTQQGEKKDVDRDYFQYGLNKSSIQESHDVILSAVFRLKRDDQTQIKQRGDDAISYRVATQPKGPFVGYTYRNLPLPFVDGKDVVEENFAQKEETEFVNGDVRLHQGNPRYIININSGTDVEIAALSEKVNHFLTEDLKTEAYTILVTGKGI